MEYQKINTLFKRDANNIIIPSQFTKPEYSYLAGCTWECTEKIDGTNIRIELKRLSDGTIKVDYCGKTSKASVPMHLMAKLKQIFGGIDFTKVFPNLVTDDVITLYGEGYGVKIQSGGNYISNGVDFILFDVKVNDWWLDTKNCEKIAAELNIKMVPIIGYFTIPEAIAFVRKGFKSHIAENKDYNAEGLVLKTPGGLLFRNKERIITKIKTCDFEKYKAKYGDAICLNQPVNPKYND